MRFVCSGAVLCVVHGRYQPTGENGWGIPLTVTNRYQEHENHPQLADFFMEMDGDIDSIMIRESGIWMKEQLVALYQGRTMAREKVFSK